MQKKVGVDCDHGPLQPIELIGHARDRLVHMVQVCRICAAFVLMLRTERRKRVSNPHLYMYYLGGMCDSGVLLNTGHCHT